MKTYRYALSFIFTFLLAAACYGQTDVKSELASARSDYNSGNLEDARFALQQALDELNNVIANEIREMLPMQLGGLPAYQPDDETVGNAGAAGIFVSRTYKTDDSRTAEVTISDHSPMIGMVNTFLSNSMVTSMILSESGQKTVKVSGYKGMLEKSEDEENGTVSYTINVPFGDSLLTLETLGVDSENDALSMAEEVPLDEIAGLVK